MWLTPPANNASPRLVPLKVSDIPLAIEARLANVSWTGWPPFAVRPTTLDVPPVTPSAPIVTVEPAAGSPSRLITPLFRATADAGLYRLCGAVPDGFPAAALSNVKVPTVPVPVPTVRAPAALAVP